MEREGSPLASAVYQDAAAQERGLIGWNQTYCQLARGSYQGRLDTLGLAGVTVSRERINVAVLQRTAPPSGRTIFARVLSDEDPWRMNSALVRPDAMAVTKGGEEQTVAFGGASDILILAVDDELLDDDPIRLPSSCTVPASEAFNFCASWILAVLAQFTLLDAGASSELTGVLPGMIVDRLQLVSRGLRRVPARAAVRHPGSLTLFRRASRVAEENVGGTLTVAELARRSGTPVESLRVAFMETVGVGPGNWLRSRRLDGARRDLLRAAQTGETVTQIATRWGFWHFGRFSASYAEQFGEVPSRTMRGERGEIQST